MIDTLGLIFIIIGLIFDIFGCLGLVRLPDVYNRLQAATKCVTMGTCSILFGTFLIVGFALHNTTEGLAIASPMAKGKPMIGKLAAMGMIAGAPAIFGAWIGGFMYSPFSAVIFLSIGAGAIFQVILTLMKWLQQENDNRLSSASIVSGFAVGMTVMYLTSILV